MISPTAMSQRAIVLMTIVGFHVVLAYLLATGLGASVLKFVAPPLDLVQLPDTPKAEEPPAPPPPNLAPIRDIDVPKPDISIDFPDSTDERIAASVSEQPLVAPVQPTAPSEPIRLVGKHWLPNTEEHYPAVARRLGIEGATNVQVCVDERGKMQGSPAVLQSSGDARLDQGALDVVRAGRYARSARGETFVPNCFAFRIIFKMK